MFRHRFALIEVTKPFIIRIHSNIFVLKGHRKNKNESKKLQHYSQSFIKAQEQKSAVVVKSIRLINKSNIKNNGTTRFKHYISYLSVFFKLQITFMQQYFALHDIKVTTQPLASTAETL